jgi:CTP:molybdopterin cytidylyltransferase MocA
LTTAALLLAAGGGTRWQGPTHKLLTLIDGQPLVLRAVAAAVEAGLDDVLVVTGAVDLAGVLPSGVVVVPNARWAEGQAGSLRAGVDAAAARGHDAVVVGLGDQPGVTASAWRMVAAAADRPIAVAAYRGRRGHPVRLAAAVWPLLPSGGDEGARGLLRDRPDLVGEVACEGDPADVDTLEDLTAWS